MVGPRVAAAAAESAVAALCQEDPSASHILNSLETKPMNHKLDSTLSGLDLESTRKECELEESKKEPGGNDQDTKDIDSYFSAKKIASLKSADTGCYWNSFGSSSSTCKTYSRSRREGDGTSDIDCY